MDATRVNTYLVHKQHLATSGQGDNVLQVVHDMVALHSTSAAAPYLTLRARVQGFQRSMLEDELYERRRLARVLCMRNTVHVVPSDRLPYFHQAYQGGLGRGVGCLAVVAEQACRGTGHQYPAVSLLP